MAITKLTITNGTMHKSAEISFNKGKIASIVGLNGHGKTQILNSLAPHGTASFKNNLTTSISPSFIISEDDKTVISSLPIYSTLNIVFEEFYIEDNYHSTASDINWIIIEKIKEKFKKISEADGSSAGKESYNNFLKDIDINKNRWGSGFLSVILSKYPMMDNWYRNPDLHNSLLILSQWDAKMKGIISYKNINADTAPVNFRFNFKNEGGPELSSFNKNTYWFIRLMRMTNTYADFKKINGTMNDDDQVIKSFVSKISSKFSEFLNQNNLRVMFNINKYSGNMFELSINYLDGDKILGYNSLSSGTKKYINIISQLGSTDENTVLLIDEPDNGLHPGLQIDLREKIHSVTQETKCVVVLTTHSVYMLNHLNNRVNTYVSVKTGNSESDLLSITEFHNSKGAHQNAQIWEMLGYGTQEKTDHVDAKSKVLLVEGESDVIYIKSFFRLNSISLDDWKVIPSYGDDKMPYDIKYMNEIIGVPFKNIKCLLDGDTKSKKVLQKKIDSMGVVKMILPVKTIEDVFIGNDKGKYTKVNAAGKYVGKLDKSIKFSYSLDVNKKTKITIDAIVVELSKLLELKE